MRYRPRQLVVRAQETASLLLSGLERERLVARFLDSYAAEFSRPGQAAHPAQYRELLATIGREALLAMVVWVDHELPRRLADGSGAQLPRHQSSTRSKAPKRAAPASSSKPTDEAIELFRDEFLVALGQALRWEDEEFEAFCRDLELYKELGADELSAAKSRRPAAPASGPFVDRVGLLLDPSMLDKARRAAAKFQLQLRATAGAALKKVFSRRREN